MLEISLSNLRVLRLITHKENHPKLLAANALKFKKPLYLPASDLNFISKMMLVAHLLEHVKVRVGILP